MAGDPALSGRVTHAGGVVWRRVDGRNEYLLARALRPSDAWVFPKGHLEDGETSEQAAVRETREETGIDATIVVPLGYLSLDFGKAAMFLMTARNSGRTTEGRTIAWFEFEQAMQALTFKESQALLAVADQIARAQP